MAYLSVIEGPFTGRTISLSDKITIGRNPTSDLCLNDTSVSRQHAEIRKKEGFYTVTDFGSANGTTVNGNTLHKHVPRPLYENDKIGIGITSLVFHGEGQVPPGEKNTSSVMPDTSKAATAMHSSLLSFVMTPDENEKARFNATIDASKSFITHSKESSTQDLMGALKRLQAMVQISVDLGAVLKVEVLAEKIMSGIFDIFPFADRAFIMLRQGFDKQLHPVAARRRIAVAGQSNEFAVSRTVIRTVTEQKQSILLSDVLQDSRFSLQKSIVELSIRSLMCAPFICQDELMGVIGVDTASANHPFNSDDLLMLTGIASQAAVAIKNSELYTAIEKETQIRTHLSRYLSKDVVEGVLDGTISLQLGGEKKRGTILFCDIVGFTSMSENLSATEVVQKLNRYYSVVTGIVTKNKGTLHKFAGDMVMAFWNVMLPDETAEENAIRTGLDLQVSVFLFDFDLENEGQRPIFLGIGCNTGEFAGGNIGGNDRMEYTIIGDNVNLAQRIESLACRWQVLVSADTIAPVKHKCISIQMPAVTVKGRTQPIVIYSVRGILQTDGSLLLSIPVFIISPDGQVIGGGLLTAYRVVSGIPELHLCTVFTLPSWEKLIIQFDLPELSHALRVQGRVSELIRVSHDGGALHSKIILTELSGDTEALNFFTSGSCLISRKNWADMKRH